jgi:xylose isomerase
MRKYAVGLWIWGPLYDRFVTSGYRSAPPLQTIIQSISTIPKVSGVELTYPDHINETNWQELRRLISDYGLQIASVYCNLSSHPKWQRGAFTSSSQLRKEAIAQVKTTMDLVADLGAFHVTFSLLQDGWDYPFQTDYLAARQAIVSALQECCDYRPDVVIGVEFKPREPRVFCHLSTAATTILIVKAVQRSNIGIVLDIGHALMANENLGNVVSLIAEHTKLTHLHLNDNYRAWDDDLIVGSVHFVEMLEFVYWLRRINYEGWYSLDIFPFRDDPWAASKTSIEFLEVCHQFLEELGEDYITKAIKQQDFIPLYDKLLQILHKKSQC